ncbi:glycosyltransferase family 2 protein [Conexibacter sp. CPCC 206217]|uniref:glycosyltransferase family 2 protein n=1 Tax=Conexibacter sp. CPCC 206217 TaxID=3064574 RepID=UPI002718D555|nr:glycosyltransferase family 2 protein [Conexibacter sp. CPCC 206217]MDO8210009.1 glycosyltransferase family 2 protein [Conexibacter sp. CPCC 206217]
MEPDVSAIIVSYADPAATRATIESLLAQQLAPLEVVVVDNHPDAPLAALLGELPAGVRLLEPVGNAGYVRACNRAAAQARGSWVWFLNPDATADPQCLRELCAAGEPDDVAVVGAQVLLPGWERVNAGDNPIHLTGLCWSGRFEEAREHGAPRDVAAVSGAALMVRRSAFETLGGFEPSYFMYQDDTDICWRARLAGWRVRFVPEAVVEHDYTFEKGSSKWYWLERNRWWTVLSNYELRTLLLLTPLLLAAEAGIVALSLRDGWWREKLRSWASLARGARALRRHRSSVQALRAVGDERLLQQMTARLDTPLFASPLARRVGPLLDAYRCGVLAALRGSRRGAR